MADFSNDYILEVNFLRKVNLLGIFESDNKNRQNYETSLVLVLFPKERFLNFLEGFYNKTQKNLVICKKWFHNILTEFQDVFTKDISVRNCRVLEYSVNVFNAKPIKQTFRRISIHLRQDGANYRQNEAQGNNREVAVLRFLLSPVMIKKKNALLRFCVNYRMLSLLKIVISIKDGYFGSFIWEFLIYHFGF